MRRMFIAPVVAVVAVALAAPTTSWLDVAYSRLRVRNYPGAKSAVTTHLATNRPTYRAEFIKAVSDCRISQGALPAWNQMFNLKLDYNLSQRQRSNVDEWLNYWCKPTSLPRPRDQDCAELGLCSISQGLGNEPTEASISSATSTSAAPSRATLISTIPPPRMSELEYATSFSGDDYAEYQNIAGPADCAEVCRRQRPCRSMTYATSSKICWLKRSKPAARSGSDFVSSYKIASPLLQP